VVILLLLPAAAVLAAVRWRLDVLGLATGALLTYAWVGLTNAIGAGRAGVIEQVVIIAAALAVSGLALRRRRRAALRPSEPDAGAVSPATTHRS
jgi:hypothetical protein